MDWQSVGHFGTGCVGAAAPEALRLYNLRTQRVFRWSWGYLFFSIPFILIGGFIAFAVEPTTHWAAFYTGLTAPVLLTTALKETAKAEKELQEVQKELDSNQKEKEQLSKEKQTLENEVEHLKFELQEKYQKLELDESKSLDTTFASKEEELKLERVQIPIANETNYVKTFNLDLSRFNLLFAEIVAMVFSFLFALDLFKSISAGFLYIAFTVIAFWLFFSLLLYLRMKSNLFRKYLKGL